MNKRFLFTLIGLIAISITGCASASASPTPTADFILTAVYQQVFIPLTQTAEAASPTPAATFTPPPSETPTAEPTSSEPLKRPVVTAFAGCWTGPGSNYTLISNINPKRYVEIIGMGNTPGWYVIRNPYFHNPCWIEAIYLRLDPRLDTSKYPVMTPGP
ncbi:MAG: hypothetical protein PHQ36_07235 [Anaerolineales bacterium]|nr:hypothetical protein [Anaerolineales bacterium]